MQRRYLKDEEQRQLLMAAKSCPSALAQRDYAWLRLLIETGMRVNELATMDLEQAQRALETGWLVVRKEQRKGKRAGHEYLVTEPVRQCLDKLVQLHHDLRPNVKFGPNLVPPLLWGRCQATRGKLLAVHISVRSLQARLKHWAYRCGLPDEVSPHWLRHTRGVNIIRRSRGNNPLKVAQLALGHTSIASTGIYTQMSREEYTRELQAVAGGRMRKADARVYGQAGAR